MKYFIPSFDDCKAIIENNSKKSFSEKIEIIDGYKIHNFDYLYPKKNSFSEPIKNSQITANELRGISFVFNEDGSLYNRYLMLNKFWNINEIEENKLENLRKLKIKNITTKYDGSLIRFIKLPNNKVIAKTIAGFSNLQTSSSNEIYNNNLYLKNIVDKSINDNVALLFEYVSSNNKIVIDYNINKLILIKARNNITGEYYNLKDIIQKYDIKETNYLNITKEKNVDNIDNLIEIVKFLENEEGVVIQFEDDRLVKLKSDWYNIRHRLLDNDEQENDVISLILNDVNKDYLKYINNSEKIKKISEIETIINKYIKFVIDQVDESYIIFKNKFNGDKDLFAKEYKKHQHFHFFMLKIKGFNIEEELKKYILKKTYYLDRAKVWIEVAKRTINQK